MCTVNSGFGGVGRGGDIVRVCDDTVVGAIDTVVEADGIGYPNRVAVEMEGRTYLGEGVSGKSDDESGWSVGWSAGWLAGWSAGWLAGWSDRSW